jgi:hypothetical protein
VEHVRVTYYIDPDDGLMKLKMEPITEEEYENEKEN